MFSIDNRTSKRRDRLSLFRKLIQTEHLNQEEKESIQDICDQYSDIFYVDGDRFSSTKLFLHEINTPASAQPINERPYRLPFRHKQEINRQIIELEENQIVVPSKSLWNGPLLIVPKKPDSEGKIKYHVCVDFRKLNSISTGDAYPLPNITEILNCREDGGMESVSRGIRNEGGNSLWARNWRDDSGCWAGTCVGTRVYVVASVVDRGLLLAFGGADRCRLGGYSYRRGFWCLLFRGFGAATVGRAVLAITVRAGEDGVLFVFGSTGGGGVVFATEGADEGSSAVIRCMEEF